MSDASASIYSFEQLASGRETGLPGISSLVHAIPELRDGTWRLGTYRVVEVRKQRSKRIVFGVVSYRKRERASPRRVVVKVYGSDRGDHSLAALRQLWDAGFHAPAAERVPQPFGYERTARALYQGHATGMQWVDLLKEGACKLRLGSRRAANWLVRLQATPIDAAPEPPRAAAQQVRSSVRELAGAFPKDRRRIIQVGETVARELAAGDVPLVSSHGDYHPKNVFLASRFVTVIDFDTFALREPSYDVGYAIAQLMIMSFFRTGTFDVGLDAVRAFRSALPGVPDETWRRERLHIARSFLLSLRYELCTLRNGRHTLLDRWPEVASLALASETPDEFTRRVV